MRFWLGHIHFLATDIDNAQFDDIECDVHLDEKWFNADKDRRKVYVTEGEEVPHRSCKKKRFMPPLHDRNGTIVENASKLAPSKWWVTLRE